jgi:FkbM family methyltransferase
MVERGRLRASRSLRRLASIVRGGLWLVRAGGLREWLERQERSQDDRLAEVDGRIEALSRMLAESSRQLSNAQAEIASQLSRIETRYRSRTEVFGQTMFLDPDDSIVCPYLLRDGCFEPFETELMRSRVKPGDVVLDIGANIGYYTLIFARLVGDAGKVYAFEPDPSNFKLLRKNVRANGHRNVVCVPRAVSDVAGPLSLFLCPDNKGDHRIYPSEVERWTVAIEAVTLDEYFDGYEGRIDFIKMDIQGAEARALRGMSGLLRAHAEANLITEFWPAGIRRCGDDGRAYLDGLEQLGYRLQHIDERIESCVPTSVEELLAMYPGDDERFGNLLCVRSAGP